MFERASFQFSPQLSWIKHLQLFETFQILSDQILTVKRVISHPLCWRHFLWGTSLCITRRCNYSFWGLGSGLARSLQTSLVLIERPLVAEATYCALNKKKEKENITAFGA